MRSDPIRFQLANSALKKKPIYVVEMSLDEDNTDLIYVTSAPGTPVPGGHQVFQNQLLERSLSGTSQTLDIKNFNSTIGKFSYSVADTGNSFSDYLRSKLASDQTVTKNRVRLYMGFPGLEFSDYALIQTQIIEREYVKHKSYKYTCYDVQRQTRKDIFDKAETILTDDIGEDETGAITVLNTEKFETYFHGVSYSSNAGEIVGHIEVTDGKSKEIITYTGKTGSTFTGLSRGAFGTQARDWVAAEEGKSKKIKVTEYIYLEMPAVKLAYAILTGSLYGDGYTLPDHWHLGIDPQYIATSKFATIGVDWWDTSDDTKGRSVRFEGLQKTDGKLFIERELYGLLGCFAPVLTTGELGLKRIAAIVSASGYSHVIDKRNIVSASDAAYEHDQVINFVKIKWGYKHDEERYSRANYFYDPKSRARHKLSTLLELGFKGLHSDKHSIDSVRYMFDGFRDRYAGPPIAITVTVLPSLNAIEVGDVVLLDLPSYPDYFGPADLNRCFEVQQTQVNWYTGAVTLKLVGSTQKASALVEYGGDETIPSGTAVPDAKYTDSGSDIESAFSGNVSRSGGTVTVDSDFTITGSGSATDPASIYYVDGDFIIPGGREVSIEGNVFLKVKGFFSCKGKMNGSGRGHAGEDYRRYQSTIVYDFDIPTGPRDYVWDQRINDAYPDGNDAANDFWVVNWREAAEGLLVINPDYPSFVVQGSNSYYRIGQNISLPIITVDPVTLSGIPEGMWGQGGPAGDSLWTRDHYNVVGNAWHYYPAADGGSGGNGGAGLVILCRGMGFFSSGQIDVSADNGAEGERWDMSGALPYSIKASDGGGGTPGNVYILIDGALNSPPDLGSSTIIANDGAAPDLTGQWDWDNFYHDHENFGYFGFGSDHGIMFRTTPNRDLNRSGSYYPRSSLRENKWQAHARVIHLIEPTEPQDQPEENTERPLGVSLTEYTNTPVTPSGNKSTIDVTVTPPSATNYSYSIIQARKQGGSGWFEVGPAQHEVSYTVDTDGSTWEFRALAVSTSGATLESGPVASITLGDFSADYATIRPPVTVTGLRLTSQAAGSVFATPDLQFTWNLNNLTGTGYTEPWFSHFKVEIRKADNSLLYTETTKTNIYTLTYSENAALSGGPYSSLQVRVYQVTVDGEEGTPANVTFTNAAPALPSGFSVTNGAYGSRIKWTNPVDVDFQRVEIYLSGASGFTPGASNKVYAGDGESVDLSNLSPATTYYYVARSRDTFGNYSSYTSESSFQTSVSDFSDIGGDTKPDDNADVTESALGDKRTLIVHDQRVNDPDNYSVIQIGEGSVTVGGAAGYNQGTRLTLSDTSTTSDWCWIRFFFTKGFQLQNFAKEFYFKGLVEPDGIHSGVRGFYGIGAWHPSTNNDHIGVVFSNINIRASVGTDDGRTEIVLTTADYGIGTILDEPFLIEIFSDGAGNVTVSQTPFVGGNLAPGYGSSATFDSSDEVPDSTPSGFEICLQATLYGIAPNMLGTFSKLDCFEWKYIQKE